MTIISWIIEKAQHSLDFFDTLISENQVFLKYKIIPFFIEYAECAFIKRNAPCNFIFQHNRKQLHFVVCDAKNRKVCLVAKIYSKLYAPPKRVVLFLKNFLRTSAKILLYRCKALPSKRVTQGVTHGRFTDHRAFLSAI